MAATVIPFAARDFHLRFVSEASAWLNQNSIQSKYGQVERFVPPRVLYDFYDYQRLLLIIQDTFPQHVNHRKVARAIRNGDGGPEDGYVRVFFILLCMGKEQRILDMFGDDILTDRYLPFHPTTTLPNGIDLPTFRRYQRHFSAPKLRQNDFEQHLPADCILPVEELEQIYEGDESIVYRVKVHEEFDLLERNAQAVNSHNYAFKVLQGSAGKSLYEAEVRGYQEVRAQGQDIDSLTRCYAHFTYHDNYFIVLAYADQGTWEEFMQREDPPTESGSINLLWEQLFNLCQPVHRLHQAYGWHQDINPNNILIRSSPSRRGLPYRLMLADFGRSHFGEENVGKDTYGTKDYGAPECYRGSAYRQGTRLNVPRTIDTWSLGCVWSEAAVWMTGGRDALQRYRKDRKEEVKSEGMEQSMCFHNRSKVLHSVTNVHNSLLNMEYSIHHLSARVCKNLLNDMLRSPAKDRLTSEGVLARTEALQDDARRLLAHNPSNIREKSATIVGGQDPQVGQSTLPRTQTVPIKVKRDVKRPHQVGISGPGRHDGDTVETPTRNMTIAESYARYQSPKQRSGPFEQPASPTRSSKSAAAGRLFAGSGPPRQSADDFVSINNDEGDDGDFNGTRIVSDRIPTRASPPQYGDEDSLYRTAPSRFSDSKRDTWHRPTDSGPSGRPFLAPSHSQGSRGLTRNEPTLPYLSINAARYWMDQKKAGIEDPYLEGGDQLKGTLNARDHVFVVDDSESTHPYWGDICGLLSLLSFMVEEDDPDGMDVHFARSNKVFERKTSEQIVQAAYDVRPRGYTNMESVFVTILKEYEKKLAVNEWERRTGRTLRGARPLSIYVLTDGAWEAGGNPAVPMLGIIHALKEFGLPREQIGIQFISFGNHAEGLRDMEVLDDMMKKGGVSHDIADTVSSEGNVWKMLLGAILDKYDNMESNLSPSMA